MDNKVNIKVSNSDSIHFTEEKVNDIICYSSNSQYAFHIGIDNTSNYMSITSDHTQFHNKVKISQDLIVEGNLLDTYGNSYSVRDIFDNAIKTHHITDANITEAKLADSSVDTRSIIDSSITAEKLALSCVSLDNIAGDVLSASNIIGGIFASDEGFSFFNEVVFNNGIHCTNQNSFIKLQAFGSPFLIEGISDNVEGKCIQIENDRTVFGNKRLDDYSSDTCAMLGLYMPNLVAEGINRTRIGKTPLECIDISYIHGDDIGTAKLQLISNNSQGSNPYLSITGDGIGINTSNIESTMHINGDTKITGNISANGDSVFNGNISINGNYLYSGDSIILDESDSISITSMASNLVISLDNMLLNAIDQTSLISIENSSSINILTDLTISKTLRSISEDMPIFANWYECLYDNNRVFSISRDGNVYANAINCSSVINNGIYAGDGQNITNIQASNIVGRVSVDNIEAIYSSNITGYITGNQIDGGIFGVVDGTNITDLTGDNIIGTYSTNAKLSTLEAYKSTDSLNRFSFIDYGSTSIFSPSDIYITCPDSIVFNNDCYITQNEAQARFNCPVINCKTINADYIEGDGSLITNIHASNLIGGVSNITFEPGIFKSGDDIERFDFNSNHTSIYGPNKVYLNSLYTYVDAIGNIVVKTREGNDLASDTDPNTPIIGNDNLGNVISCFTAVNGYSEQNISDPNIELRGTISLRHPNASNNNIRALTISHGSNNNVTSYITSSGYIYSEGIYYTSDKRVKTDIIGIKNGLDIIARLKPSQYTKWDNFSHTSSSSSLESGFIAQDIYDNIPELRHIIHISEDADLENNYWGSSKARINYQEIIPYLVAAINEQNTIIEELRKEILFVK